MTWTFTGDPSRRRLTHRLGHDSGGGGHFRAILVVVLGAFQFQELPHGQRLFPLLPRLAPSAAALRDRAHDVLLVVRVLDHVVAQVLQGTERLVADLTGQHSAHGAIGLSSCLGVAVMRSRWRT